MAYPISAIAETIKPTVLSAAATDAVAHLVYDSRAVAQPATSLFFALVTPSGDGHLFILAAAKQGVRNFVVSTPISVPGANVLLVPDVLKALQRLASMHRRQFSYPVIGITGSNGKTVVKEWLYQLLHGDYAVVRSPKSFNSQLGVPLSVWEMGPRHNLAIIEAGISQPGEMQSLQQIIRPTIGILTNIGEAHSEGFASAKEKLAEKMRLFGGAEVVIGSDVLLDNQPAYFTWGKTETATLRITGTVLAKQSAIIQAVYRQRAISITIPFTDEASIQNAITCWCVLLYLGRPTAEITGAFRLLHPVDMRLQLSQGINHCLVINDSYSADVTSLKIALSFLAQQSAGLGRTIILSDFLESGKEDTALYAEIFALLKQYKTNRLIAIGEGISRYAATAFDSGFGIETYSHTAAFVQTFRPSLFRSEAVLIKGSRRAGFERIADLFQKKQHGTVLQISLPALAHNLRQYGQKLQPQTKVMAMVKAFSYGSGGAEIASVLQARNVAYLGVAYADEGADLVQAGIGLPVMVMNAEEGSFASIVAHRLQPVIYSMALLLQFEKYLSDQGLTAYPVHLEVETGMNRLGFAHHETEAAAAHLAASAHLQLQSVFTHLAASESPEHDAFTALQADRFAVAVAVLQRHIQYPFLRHISNTAAIIRHPQLQLDMVRLGIGLYGVGSGSEEALNLQPVATLRSTIAQLKHLQAGESVSYNRRGLVYRPSVIATVRIGYADGYSRRLGNGMGKMLVRGVAAPVIGAVCMDMTMLDVTDVPGVAEGDDVIVFGEGLPLQQMADWAGTIPYEIMTSLSQRVKRVYYE